MTRLRRAVVVVALALLAMPFAAREVAVRHLAAIDEGLRAEAEKERVRVETRPVLRGAPVDRDVTGSPRPSRASATPTSPRSRPSSSASTRAAPRSRRSSAA